jgi:hypothetical protein
VPAAWKTWFPRLFAHYNCIHQALCRIDTRLQVLYQDLPFAAMTVNFGPQTCCLPHRDFQNLSYGLCAVLVLGRFDFTKGGHLVLHEASQVVETCEGSIILFPSSCVTHENLPVLLGESRFSIVWYSAGGLWRWKDNGMQSEEKRAQNDPAGYEVYKHAGTQRGRWLQGCSLYSSVQELGMH